MPDLVRVVDPATMNEFTTTREFAEERSFNILKTDATGPSGAPLPPTYPEPEEPKGKTATATAKAETTTKKEG